MYVLQITQTNSDLQKSGILSGLLQSASINNDFTFNNLVSKQTVTFFTNWTDKTNFPAQFGSGIMIPSKDSRYKFVLYITAQGLWYGRYIDNSGIEWSKNL